MKIAASTSCAAVIGHPISHSISPELHNRIYQALGLDIVYLAFNISKDNFAQAIKGLGALGFIGFNVTIPYKETIIPYLDSIDPAAAAIGAINTVKIDNGKLIGYNTDGLGFLDSLTINNIYCSNRRILIIGAGGSARAIGICLIEHNPREIIILNRRMDRSKQLALDINKFAKRSIAKAVNSVPEDVDIIINTTPLGMWPNVEQSPLEGYVFNSKTVVCDIIYNPYMTTFLKRASGQGCLTVNGLGMLIGQGVKAIEIWADKKVDSSIITMVYDELRNKLKQQNSIS
ncbi:MAG: shikimate dehydrogenase [Caldicoprobacterales bacterium]|jgi:shikimate dehydrogenase|nr:shikimate dehydrogenase [Clostridiales bacterium]